MPNSPLTAEQKKDAERLRHLFEKYRLRTVDREGRPLTLTYIATEKMKRKQSAVSQWLNGSLALSPEAAVDFAKVIGCSVADFSPRLAKQIASLAESAWKANTAATPSAGAWMPSHPYFKLLAPYARDVEDMLLVFSRTDEAGRQIILNAVEVARRFVTNPSDSVGEQKMRLVAINELGNRYAGHTDESLSSARHNRAARKTPRKS